MMLLVSITINQPGASCLMNPRVRDSLVRKPVILSLPGLETREMHGCTPSNARLILCSLACKSSDIRNDSLVPIASVAYHKNEPISGGTKKEKGNEGAWGW